MSYICLQHKAVVVLINGFYIHKDYQSQSVFVLLSVESYVKSLGQSELLDLLVRPSSEDVDMEEVEDLRPSKRKVIYTEVCGYFISF